MSDTSFEDPYDFGVDPDIEDITGFRIERPNERVAIIRTSDRSNFKRCRRRWGWQSHLRGNLTPVESASPLWYGSGFHFAMEDFHGPKNYRHPTEAFKAYVLATHKMARARSNPFVLPHDWRDLVVLGEGMIEYYADVWLTARDPLTTFVYNGVPQVEVHALVEVPFHSPHYDRVLYAVTLDRVVIDANNNLWIVDYKTAKRIQTNFFQTDPQISAYCWIGNELYKGYHIAGFIYQQHKKTVPIEPRQLSNGKISTSRHQSTSHRLYRRSLINLYGAVDKAPIENVDFLNWLAEQEDQSKDPFVRRDKVFRNSHQAQAEGAKLLLELEDMLNPDLPLYPNPTRECGHMCSFNTPCVNMDDGSDWEQEIELGFIQKDANFDSWRQYL